MSTKSAAIPPDKYVGTYTRPWTDTHTHADRRTETLEGKGLERPLVAAAAGMTAGKKKKNILDI